VPNSDDLAPGTKNESPTAIAFNGYFEIEKAFGSLSSKTRPFGGGGIFRSIEMLLIGHLY
jgi:hypothetical protein